MAGDRLPTKAFEIFFFFMNCSSFEFLTVMSVKNTVGCDAVYPYRYISNFTIIRCRDSGSLWAGRFGVGALVGGLRFFSFPHSSRQILGVHSVSRTMGSVSLQRIKWPGPGLDLPYPHLAQRLKKEYSYTTPPPSRLRGILRGYPLFTFRRNLLPLFCFGKGATVLPWRRRR